MNAVISKEAWHKITGYIKAGKDDKALRLVYGGDYDSSKGYFISPTVFEVQNPRHALMCEEIFGPVLAVYVYDDSAYDDVLDTIDKSVAYGLTGAIFAKDRRVVSHTLAKLKYAAGNVYINDKPTGAVVGQQPFGGARASGTNDKAGAALNLMRWMSPRTIKEVFVPPTNYAYPYMKKE